MTAPFPKGIEKAREALVDVKPPAGSGLSAEDWPKSSVLGLIMYEERTQI